MADFLILNWPIRKSEAHVEADGSDKLLAQLFALLYKKYTSNQSRCSSITTYDAYVQVCLGEGDGRDSYCDAGNFSTFESNADENDEKKRSVAVQVYFPLLAFIL